MVYIFCYLFCNLNKKKTAITDTKFYVPVATLSTNENAELLQQLKTSFKGTITWIRYQSKATIKKQNQYLDYLNDHTIIFIVFWDFLVFYQIFFSPQAKRCSIITYEHGIYELPHELPKDLRATILGN